MEDLRVLKFLSLGAALMLESAGLVFVAILAGHWHRVVSRRRRVCSPVLEKVTAVDAPWGFPGVSWNSASNNVTAWLPGREEGMIWGETWCNDLQPSQKSKEAAGITWP